MEEARANSLRVHFGPGKIEPTVNGIFQFMKSEMKLSPDSLLAMYKEPKEHSVYIKFKTEKQLKETILQLPSTMQFGYDDGQSTKVTISEAANIFKYVRIFNLPPEVEDQEISEVLSKYGTIHRMVKEKYGADTGFPIWTSVRGVHMEIQKEIPATLHVRNFQARIYYEGLMNKCFVCGGKDHIKAQCPKRGININDRLNQNAPARYSDVAASTSRWFPNRKTNVDNQSDGMIVLGKVLEKKNSNPNSQPKLIDVPKPNDEPKPVEEPKTMVPTTTAVPEVFGATKQMVTQQTEDEQQREDDGGRDSEDVSDSELSESNDAEMTDGLEETKNSKGRKRKTRNLPTVSENSTESDSGTSPGKSTAKISSSQSMITRGRSKQQKIAASNKTSSSQ